MDAGEGGKIEEAGTLDAKGETGAGGEIVLIGSEIDVLPGALILADGETQGGTVQIGGDLAKGEVAATWIDLAAGSLVSVGSQAGPGGGIRVLGGPDSTVNVNGELNAASDGDVGGSILVQGREIGLGSLALLNASGFSGGGTVLGGWRGARRRSRDPERRKRDRSARRADPGRRHRNRKRRAGGGVSEPAARFRRASERHRRGRRREWRVCGIVGEKGGEYRGLRPFRERVGGRGTWRNAPDRSAERSGGERRSWGQQRKHLYGRGYRVFFANGEFYSQDRLYGSGCGNISVNPDVNITWDSGNDLTFDAVNDFVMLAGSTLGATFHALDPTGGGPSGSVNVTAGRSISIQDNASIITGGGSIQSLGQPGSNSGDG